MKIIHKKDILHVNKPEGTKVDYYLRKEYELHYNEQIPKTTQTWHHHEKILESIYIIEGELTAEWKLDGKTYKEVVKTGDLIETEDTPHTFTNHTNEIIKFIVIKQVLSGENKAQLLKTDKVIDE